MEKQDNNIQKPSAIKPYGNDKAETIAAIKKFADDDDDEKSEELSWRSVLGGDVLQSRMLMKQVIFVMFIAILMLIYTGNRYSCQQDAIVVRELQKELLDAQWEELTIEGDLTNMKRQSVLELMMREQNDTSMLNIKTPHYIIRQDN